MGRSARCRKTRATNPRASRSTISPSRAYEKAISPPPPKTASAPSAPTSSSARYEAQTTGYLCRRLGPLAGDDGFIYGVQDRLVTVAVQEVGGELAAFADGVE